MRSDPDKEKLLPHTFTKKYRSSVISCIAVGTQSECVRAGESLKLTVRGSKKDRK